MVGEGECDDEWAETGEGEEPRVKPLRAGECEGERCGGVARRWCWWDWAKRGA